MNRLIYQSVKIAFGVAFASIIASLIGLSYYTTAGVIALLSILDTRKQTYVTGLKRILNAAIAIILASILFTIWGHETYVLGIFLLVFIPISTLLKSTEGISISTVLVTHIYTINTINLGVVANEMFLLFIGISVAWLLNLHMPNTEGTIQNQQRAVENLMKDILHNLHLTLLNEDTDTDTKDLLADLKTQLLVGKKMAYDYNNNYILKDEPYYYDYFQMRKEQYLLLVQISKHFETIFFSVAQAKELSDLTAVIRDNLSENNDGKVKWDAANALLVRYRNSPLPTNRQEFENRAVLYQYLTDLKRFIQIKAEFISQNGSMQ